MIVEMTLMKGTVIRTTPLARMTSSSVRKLFRVGHGVSIKDGSAMETKTVPMVATKRHAQLTHVLKISFNVIPVGSTTCQFVYPPRGSVTVRKTAGGGRTRTGVG
jgi:hypothetical protein